MFASSGCIEEVIVVVVSESSLGLTYDKIMRSQRSLRAADASKILSARVLHAVSVLSFDNAG